MVDYGKRRLPTLLHYRADKHRQREKNIIDEA
jgi:hypothetical protein